MLRIGLSLVALVVVLGAQSVSGQTPAASKPGSGGEPRARTAAVVNLNTATAADLEHLPGIGAKTAARIVEYRTRKGPFRKIEELMNVQGVGEKSFLRIRQQLTVSGTAPASQQ